MKSKQRKPFALKVQTTLIVLLLLCFLLMMQTYSQGVYTFGTILLILTAIVQIVFGNINPDYGFAKTTAAFFKIFLIVVVVFAAGIFLAPLFLNTEFVKIFMILIIVGSVGGFTLALFIKPKKRR